MFDIDHFKRINDSFGHLFGDEVLLLFAERMRSCFRAQDKLFRFGGEEFVVMIRHVREDHVRGVFERFRRSIERYDFPQVGQVTCSVGYTRIDPAYTPAELLGRADAALYYAKEHGRNRVDSFDELVMQGPAQAGPGSGSQQHPGGHRRTLHLSGSTRRDEFERFVSKFAVLRHDLRACL